MALSTETCYRMAYILKTQKLFNLIIIGYSSGVFPNDKGLVKSDPHMPF